MIKQELKKYLKKYCTGYERRVTIDMLVYEFHIENREIRDMMYELKLDGFPIIPAIGSSGYFVPRKNNEVDFKYLMRYYYSQHSRIGKIAMGLKCFNQFFPKGQLVFMDAYKPVEKEINKFLDNVKERCQCR